MNSDKSATQSTSSVLLVMSGMVHPSLIAIHTLRRVLEHMRGYRFRRTPTLESLPEIDLSAFQALLVYIHQEELSDRALEALRTYVRQGGGLFGLHSASASFKSRDDYYEILGGRFEHHGPVRSFRVEPAPSAGETFAGIEAFTVRDELYRHQYDPGNQVHFVTSVDGEIEPVVWTRPFGEGRVFYCALGHRAAVFRQPTVRRILRRGLNWTCQGPTKGISD